MPAGGSPRAPTAGVPFAPIAVKPAVPVTGFADLGDGRLALVGPRGVAVTDGPLTRHRNDTHHGNRLHRARPDARRPDVAEFDRNSGNWLERLVFNNRLTMVSSAVVTAVLGFAAATRLVLNASFEKMIPQSQPNIKNYLPIRRSCAASATRCASLSRTPTATS